MTARWSPTTHAVLPEHVATVGHRTLEGSGDGAYRATATMVVTDNDGAQLAKNRWEDQEFSIVNGQVDCEIPAGDSTAATLPLPDLAAGNHGANIELALDPASVEGGNIDDQVIRTNIIVTVCYQDTGPVEVLLG